MEREVVVRNDAGLHARPATIFVHQANKFKSNIFIEKDSKRVNAKSIIFVLSLGVSSGTKIKIIAQGIDEEIAVNSLAKLVENNFVNSNL